MQGKHGVSYNIVSKIVIYKQDYMEIESSWAKEHDEPTIKTNLGFAKSNGN